MVHTASRKQNWDQDSGLLGLLYSRDFTGHLGEDSVGWRRRFI